MSTGKRKKKKRKGESRSRGGAQSPLPCLVLGEATPDTLPPFHLNPTRAPTYVEGQKFSRFSTPLSDLSSFLLPHICLTTIMQPTGGSRDQLLETQCPCCSQDPHSQFLCNLSLGARYNQVPYAVDHVVRDEVDPSFGLDFEFPIRVSN